jgi:DNA-directed RNA polymerase specialized sigma24 family protein
MLMFRNDTEKKTMTTMDEGKAGGTATPAAGNPFWEEREESFRAARQYLLRVRELTQKITLLRNRIAYREDDLFDNDSQDVVDIEKLRGELEDVQRELRLATVQVTDLIGELKDATQQVVMTKRYVEGKSWDAIALQMDIGVRAVQRAHGKALLYLDRLLTKVTT